MIYLLKEEHRRFFLPRLILCILSLVFILFLPMLDLSLFMKVDFYQNIFQKLPYILLILLFVIEVTTSLGRYYRGKEHILLLYPLRAEEIILSKLLHLLGSYSIIYWIHIFLIYRRVATEDLVVYFALLIQITFFILLYFWIEMVQMKGTRKKGFRAFLQILVTIVFFAAILFGFWFLSFYWTPKESLVLQFQPLLLKRSIGVYPIQYLIWALYMPLERAEGLFVVPLLVMVVSSFLMFAWLSHLFESRIDWYRKE